MAIILPFYMILLLGIVDFCRVFYVSVGVTQAARAGAQYGVQNTNSGPTPLPTGMRGAAASVMTDYRLTGAPTPAVQTYCVCSSSTPVPSCPTPGPSCNPTPACTPSGSYQKYVCTSTSYDFSTFAPYPGVPSSLTVTRTATMRAQ